MQENVSPEEKLLNLIKNGNNTVKDKPKELPKAQNIVNEKKEAVKIPKTAPKKIKKTRFNLFPALNKLLFLVVLASAAYAVFSYINSYKAKIKIPEIKEISREGKIKEETLKPLPALSDYMNIVNRRQMFKLYEAPKPTPTGPAKPKVTLQQLLGGYTFVGIIFGDVPQAIVEERKSGQSYYLTSGQMLGEIKIEKIEKGKITVSYEGETMEISI